MAWQEEMKDEVRQMMDRVDQWKNMAETEEGVGDNTKTALDGVNSALRNVVNSIGDEESKGGFKGLFS